MKKLFLFLVSYVLILASAFSQTAPAIEWQNTIGGSANDQLYSIQQTSDGGYILGGWSYSNISGDKIENALGPVDYWVVKLDATGAIQWQNTIGGNDYDLLSFIQQTTDNGFILSGRSNSNISGDKTENCLGSSDFWVVKLDSLGNIQWQNTIGGNSIELSPSIWQTNDGGYILGGCSYSNISGDKTENSMGLSDYWVLKLDAAGAIEWQNTIGGNNYDILSYIKKTLDSGYVLGGFSNSNISGDKTEDSLGGWDYWIVNLDSNGTIQWQNTIGGSNDDRLLVLQLTSDSGYILGGWSDSNISGDKTENCLGGHDYWIIKLDSIGSIQWQNTIGGTAVDVLTSIQQTFEGGYILGGFSNSNISGDKIENNIGGGDYWVLKLDSSGNIQWQNTIGGNNDDNLYSIWQTTEGGYVGGGFSNSNISGDKTENCIGSWDYWIIKLFPDTITGIIQHPDNGTGQNQLSVYPNPADEELTVSGLQFPINKIEIINLLGETVFSREPKTVNCKLQTSSFPPGMYIIKAYSDKGVFQQKLVINH